MCAAHVQTSVTPESAIVPPHPAVPSRMRTYYSTCQHNLEHDITHSAALAAQRGACELLQLLLWVLNVRGRLQWAARRLSLSAGPDLTFISSAHAALMWAKMKDQMGAAMTSLWPFNPGEATAAIFCDSTNQHDIKMIPRTISFGSRRRRHNDTKLCWIQLCLQAGGWLESKTGHLTCFLREEMKHPGQPKEKQTIPHQVKLKSSQSHCAPLVTWHWRIPIGLLLEML